MGGSKEWHDQQLNIIRQYYEAQSPSRSNVNSKLFLPGWGRQDGGNSNEDDGSSITPMRFITGLVGSIINNINNIRSR